MGQSLFQILKPSLRYVMNCFKSSCKISSVQQKHGTRMCAASSDPILQVGIVSNCGHKIFEFCLFQKYVYPFVNCTSNLEYLSLFLRNCYLQAYFAWVHSYTALKIHCNAKPSISIINSDRK